MPQVFVYTGSDGLTLNLNDPGLTVHATTAWVGGVVHSGGAVGNTNDLVVNASSLTSISRR